MNKIILAVALLFAGFTCVDAQVYDVGKDKDGDEWYMDASLSRKTGNTVFAAVELDIDSSLTMSVLVEFVCGRNRMKLHKALLFSNGTKIKDDRFKDEGYIKPFYQFVKAYDYSCKSQQIN